MGVYISGKLLVHAHVITILVATYIMIHDDSYYVRTYISMQLHYYSLMKLLYMQPVITFLCFSLVATYLYKQFSDI